MASEAHTVVGLTGATGLIGSQLLPRLSAHSGTRVRALTRTISRSLPELPHVEWMHGDLGSRHDAASFVRDLDVVVHLAHTNTPLTSNEDLPADGTANLLPMLSLLQAIRDQRRSCHVVYASSGGALYRPARVKRPFRETDQCEPTTSYGIQKLIGEHYLRLAAEEGSVSAVALRIGNAYGVPLRRERRQGFIGVAVADHAAGRPVRLFGNPDNVRDYVHLDDVCRAFERAIDRREGFRIYNIGSGDGASVRTLLELIETVSGESVRTEIDVAAGAGHLPEWAILDAALAAAELDWRPEVRLEDGVRRLWDAVVAP